jgi:hypothetical protein
MCQRITNNPVNQRSATFVASRLILASKNNHETWLLFHVHTGCLNDRYPTLNTCTLTMVIHMLCLQYTRVMFTVHTCYVCNIHVLCLQYKRAVYNVHVLCLQYTRVMYLQTDTTPHHTTPHHTTPHITVTTAVYLPPNLNTLLLSQCCCLFASQSPLKLAVILYNWIVMSSATFSL